MILSLMAYNAYNAVYRKMFGYSYRESVTLLQHTLGRPTWEELIDKMKRNFNLRISQCPTNSLVRAFGWLKPNCKRTSILFVIMHCIIYCSWSLHSVCEWIPYIAKCHALELETTTFGVSDSVACCMLHVACGRVWKVDISLRFLRHYTIRL